jgi:hypothetical protein
LPAVLGCSTATIQRRDGVEFEGRIEGSTARTLYVRDRHGELLRFDRNDVADIDHPGNAALSTGLFMGLFWGIGDSSISSDDRERYLGRALLLSIPALALAIGGGLIYYRSHAAARKFEEAPIYLRFSRAP